MKPQFEDGPAPSGADAILAGFLEAAFERYVRGEPVAVSALLAHAPHLVAEGKQLLADVHDLFAAAVGLRSRSWLLESEQLEQTLDNPAVLEEAPPDPFPGEYRLVRLLGQGAFGTVWQAEDLHLGRQVAVKMIRAGAGSAESGRLLGHLRDEARLLAALHHPNIVPVYSWREVSSAVGLPTACLIMRLVTGGSLAERVQREEPLPWRTAAHYLADVADGLRVVHSAGVVHRDVKPANLLWDPEADTVLLTDFGISARLADNVGGGGTPFFMPPEAFEGQISPAQDVFGLAATLFCLVTGSVPFPGPGSERVQQQARAGLPELDSRCIELPPPLERLIRAGLTADPARRPSLADFATALRGILNGLLADSLSLSQVGRPAPVLLRLAASRQVGRGNFEPVAVLQPAPERLLRDLKRVPLAPERVELFTGERLRIEVETDRAGFVTVFNVGPTGNLNVLYPEPRGSVAVPAALPAGKPLTILDVALLPPTGQERVFALWSRTALPLALEQLLDVAGQPAASPSQESRATRDMKRIQETVDRLDPEDWHVAVLELSPPRIGEDVMNWIRHRRKQRSNRVKNARASS